MPDRHERRRPEQDEEAELHRVAHEAIEQRRAERHARRRAAQRAPRAVQPEQLGVADGERRDDDERAAGPEERAQQEHGGRRAHAPQHAGHRLPEQHEREQRERRQQHVGAALDHLRHEPRPPALEAGARHHAVLRAEARHEQQVEQERGPDGAHLARVHAAPAGDAREERDEADDRDEEDEVADERVGEREQPRGERSRAADVHV
jgi:hypothetical protein